MTRKIFHFFVPVFTVYRWWELIKAGVESACGIAKKKRSFKRGRYAGNSRSPADRIEVHDAPPFLPLSFDRGEIPTGFLPFIGVKRWKVPTWKSVRELNDTWQSKTDIYIYIRLSLLEKREKHFSSGKRFLSGSGIFRIYIGKLFRRSRERERNHFVLFHFSFSFRKIVLIIPPLNCTSSVYFEIYRASRISHFFSEIKYFFSEIWFAFIGRAEFSVGDEIEFGITVEDKCWSKSEKRSIVDTIEGYLDSRVYIRMYLFIFNFYREIKFNRLR